MIEAGQPETRTAAELRDAVLKAKGAGLGPLLDALVLKERQLAVAAERRRAGGLLAQHMAFVERLVAATKRSERIRFKGKEEVLQWVLRSAEGLADDIRSGSVGGRDMARFQALIPTAHCRRMGTRLYVVSTAGAADEFVARGGTVAEAWAAAWKRATHWVMTGDCAVAEVKPVIDAARRRMAAEGWKFGDADPVYWG